MPNDVLIGYIYSSSYDHEATNLLPEYADIEGSANWKIRDIEFGFVYDTTPGINWLRSVQIDWVISLNNITFKTLLRKESLRRILDLTLNSMF